MAAPTPIRTEQQEGKKRARNSKTRKKIKFEKATKQDKLELNGLKRDWQRVGARECPYHIENWS